MKFLWLFFCCGVLSAAPVRVALIGDGNAVDPVAAELSAADGIELLERSKIDAVLSEHRLNAAGLSAGILAKHFPHADAFAVFTHKRLVVFNAKNAFRLWDDSPENAARKIIAAKDKLAVENPLYLSIVSVHDVGVPRRLKPKIEEFVTLFEQELIKSPSIQMLERSRLGAVNRERELSGKSFALTPSARLLTLEFEPGGEAAIVNVKLIVRNLGNQKLAVFEQTDTFSNIPQHTLGLQRKLISFLTQGNILISDRKKEAARFFKAAQSMKFTSDNRGAVQKNLESAIALDPENDEYRVELKYFRWKLLAPQDSLTKRTDLLEKIFTLECRRNGSMQRILWILRGGVEGAWERALPDERKRLSAFCSKFREQWFAEWLRNESPEANTWRELTIRMTYLHGLRDFPVYFDVETYKRDVLKCELERLLYFGQWLQRHPQMKIEGKKIEEWALRNLAPAWFGTEWNYRKIPFVPEDFNSYCRAAEAHPLDAVKAFGLLTELYAKTGYGEENFRKVFLSFTEQFAILKLPTPHKIELLAYLDKTTIYGKPELMKIAKKIIREKLPECAATEDELFIEKILAVKDPKKLPQFLLDHKDECLKHEKELRNIPLGDGWRGSMGWLLTELILHKNVPEAEAVTALNEVFNHEMNIEKAASDWNDGSCFYDWIAWRDQFYIAAWNGRRNCIRIFCFDPNMERLHIVSNISEPQSGEAVSTMRGAFSRGYALDTDGVTLAIGVKDAIHLLNLQSGQRQIIRDLPNPHVNAIALMGGRVYIWSGIIPNYRGDGEILFSCDYNGGKRKFHWNSKQRGDKPYLSFCGMTADRKRKRLLILSARELYEYIPAADSFRSVLKQPDNASSRNREATRMQPFADNMIHLAFGGDLIRFNPADDTARWYFSGLEKCRTRSDYFFRKEDGLAPGGLFFRQGEHLWISEHTGLICIRFDGAIGRQIFFYYPFEEYSKNGIAFLQPALDDNSVYLLRGSDILKLSPKSKPRRNK